MSSDLKSPEGSRAGWPDYRAVWRWHFYAGLFCLPFVIILSISGAFYLFKTEIEAWEERRFDSLSKTEIAETAPSKRIQAAIDAIPGSRLSSYELPQSENSATRVIVRKGGETIRVFVHPTTLEVLGEMPERNRFMRIIKVIHGELMLGPRGSYIVEMAASWTIVMILTGIYLWWPRNAKGWGGLLYPRLTSTSKVFWKDLHSVPGMWISGMALVLLLSGLPWSNFWGDYFKTVRRLTGTAVARQDWSNRGEEEESKGGGEHQGHSNAPRKNRTSGDSGWKRGESRAQFDIAAVDRIVPEIESLRLAHPVTISPPIRDGGNWSVRSNAPNRPLRSTLTVNGTTGDIVSREDFRDRHILDKIVGYGIAIHEGQLFGLPNQLLGLTTATGLVLLSVSGIVLWWRRRDRGVLGAPVQGSMPCMSFGLLVIVLGLGIYLPMFGASLILVLLVERLVLRRIPRAAIWLGLRPLSTVRN